MIEVVISENIETKQKYLEVVEIKSDEKYIEIVDRVKAWNEKKQSGRTWKIINGVDSLLKECLLEAQNRERGEAIRTRDDINDYFRDAKEAIENLESIYNSKY